MDKYYLIKLVRDEPMLWDQQHKNYYNRDIKPILWDQIGKTLNVPARQAQKSWECLRDMYRKHLKEASKLKSGDKANPVKEWRYFESMDFLRVVVISRLSMGNADFSDVGQSCSSSKSDGVTSQERCEESAAYEYSSGSYNHANQDYYDVKLETDSINSYCKETDEGLPQKEIKKLIENKALELENRKMQILEDIFEEKKSNHDDEDYLFLKSLLPSLRKLDDVEKMQLKTEILTAVTKKLEEKRNRDIMMSDIG